MKALRIVPLALILAACSTNLSLSPYRIDVQQGNALEQESVEKLRPGLTRSQVRFLLGTPLVVDPFHSNRWDYVYNYRKAGKLTEERRLVLFFDGDVLARIEAEGFAPKDSAPEAKPSGKPVVPMGSPAAEPAPAMTPPPAEPAKPSPAPAGETRAKPIEPTSQSKPVAEPMPTQAAPAKSVSTSERSLGETSVVAPLKSGEATPTQATDKAAAASETKPEPLTLQTDTNVEAIKTGE